MIKLFLAILPTLLLASYGQLVTKWRVSDMAGKQAANASALERLLVYLLDPFIISAYIFSLLSAFAWVYVIEKYPVSIAFPVYTGLLFVAVLLGSSLWLQEPITIKQISGIVLIILGVVVANHA